MHKAKTPKLLISAIAIFGLIFGGSLVSVAPANAAGINGCVNSGWQPNDCGGTGTASVVVPAVDGTIIVSAPNGTNIASNPLEDAGTPANNQNTCSSGSPTFTLYAASDTSFNTALSNVNSYIFSSSTGRFSANAGTITRALATTNYIILKDCSSGLTRYSLNITINSSAPEITPATQNITGTVGSAITASTAYTPANMTSTYSYAVTSGTLPAGLSISATTGQITGTPTATSSSTITVTCTDSTSGTAKTATATVTFSITAAPQVQNNTTPEPDRKVTICHRTHSETNPYVRITVDYNSVNKKSGHQIHDEIFAGEHVFKAGIYKRAKDKDWGDIIPADPSGLNRWKPLNWTTLGAQIYNGTVAGCPAYDAVKYYNAMREAGVPEKKIKQEMKELEDEQSEAQPSREKKDPTTLKYSGTNTKALEEENDKVTICHRTNSVTNPYVRITVSSSSIYKTKGHYGHDEIYDGNHVFDSTVDYPNNRKDWGDIIPADPTGKNRWAPLNMTALGKKIYDGTVAGCAEKTAQQLYNELREEGKSKKEIMKELEEQKSLDEDPKDLDEIKYTGNDPEVEKTEPKEPVEPSNVVIPDQSLSGIVWLDINKDGLKDPDEPLMKNIKLYVVQVSSIPTPVSPASLQSSSTLRRADVPVRSAAVKEVLTDANGFYLFASLGAGDWMVTTTIPQDLYVTYDSHESSDGSITTTVPVASHAFTWVGLVGDDEKVTLAKLTEILKENPNALPESELPAALKVLVKKAKAALAGKTSLAETGTQDLAWFYFGILLMLTGVALRFARTKQ